MEFGRLTSNMLRCKRGEGRRSGEIGFRVLFHKFFASGISNGIKPAQEEMTVSVSILVFATVVAWLVLLRSPASIE